MDLAISNLGPATRPSPLLKFDRHWGSESRFYSDEDRVRYDIKTISQSLGEDASFECAGPRREIYFDPATTRAAIVTCGGLCPGLNDVIRGIVHELNHWYGIDHILGIRHGYVGMVPDTPYPPMELTTDNVKDIHRFGGTILGSSRGSQDVGQMVDFLSEHGVNLLFCIGGDGTLRGAHEIACEARTRQVPLAVVGVPKTIDNDIELIYRSFGFETAVAEAKRIIDGAHVEATGYPGGVALVKLMGRDSGFIAAHATIASGDVNVCLVPEVPIRLEGPGGLIEHLRERLQRRGHAVVVIAEGAGRDLFGDTGERDASGNIKFHDVGLKLKESLETAFAANDEKLKIRYFDPSYTIRSVPANPSDSIFCSDLARQAVHAAMSGKTDLMIGVWHGVFTHVPLQAVVGRRKQIKPASQLWRAVVSVTGQPARWE